MSQILLHIYQSVARLTINRADKHNAITVKMWHEINQHCRDLAENKAIKVLVITGAGDKAFSAGADIGELKANIQDISSQHAANKIIQQTQQTIARLPFFTIAAINGVCMGGGVGISLACDYRIAVSKAKFAITPAKLGLLYSIADTQRVVNIVGLVKAKEMLLLAKEVNAEQALNDGLINQIVTRESLASSIEVLTEQAVNNSSVSIKGMKQTLAFLTGDKCLLEGEISALFNKAFELDDFKEGAAAFVEKRQAKFK